MQEVQVQPVAKNIHVPEQHQVEEDTHDQVQARHRVAVIRAPGL